MIRAENIAKAFDGRPVLRGLGLSLERGQKIVLSGRSGSGKSTLLRLLAGLEAPDAGAVSIDGQPASTPQIVMPPHQRRLGVVFQQPALWPHMSVRRNLGFVMRHGDEAQRPTRLSALARACGIEDLLERYPDALSGGQARRVALARAMAAAPHYLLLDEPTSNLDAPARVVLNAAICDFVTETGAGLLYISHDASDVAQIGGTHMRMVDGALVSETGQ